MRSWWKAFRADESGQDLAEYALLIALIAIAVVVALPPVGAAIARVFTNVAGSLNQAGGTGGTAP
jgi:Flp pilus assembly pilin Flp